MKTCLFCTCMGQLSGSLNENDLHAALGGKIRVVTVDRLCHRETCSRALETLENPACHMVVAACSLSARGAQALNILKDLAPGAQCEIADIREGCVWVGTKSPVNEVTTQAASLIHMAFSRLEEKAFCPAVPSPAPVTGGVLVIGAGPAGMAAASTLSQLGIPVTLAERRASVGGMLQQLGKLFPHMSAASTVLSSIPLDGAIVLTGTEVTQLARRNSSYVASFKSKAGETTACFGSVILATGAQPVLPRGSFRSGVLKNVISQMELDSLLSAVEQGRKEHSVLPDSAVFIQCVHAREDDAPYCSSICCPTAVKNALRLKALSPDTSVTVLNRQMVMPGIALEEMYRKAMNAGVRFLHVDDTHNLGIEGEDFVVSVLVPGNASRAEERITADCVICSTPLRPAPSSVKLAEQLGLRMDGMRFVRGHEPAHPLESDAEGVFLCGSVRWPSFTDQAVEQGRAAAVLAARFLKEGLMPMHEMYDYGPTAVCHTDLCSGCGRCVEVCPHKACTLGPAGTPVIEEMLCRRCGSCSSVCRCHAMTLPTGVPSTREILAALGKTAPRQRSLA